MNKRKKSLIIIMMMLLCLLMGVPAFAQMTISRTKVDVHRNLGASVQLNGNSGKISYKIANGNVKIYKIEKGRYYFKGIKEGKTSITFTDAKKQKVKVDITVKRPLKIAVAYDNGGNTGAVVGMLQSLGASVRVVTNCDPKDYDGFVLPGGADINPARYKQGFHGATGCSNYLDRIQFTMMKKFVDAKKPILGICRGNQLINVYFGGTLIQHTGGHRGLYHDSSISKGSTLYNLYGSKLRVLSWHHQAVDKLGKGLKITQKKGKIVEAVEHQTLPIIGVQWHPEYMGNTGKVLFKEFIKRCL